MNETNQYETIVSASPEGLVECFTGLNPDERLEMATSIGGILNEVTMCELDVLIDAFGSLYTRAFSKRRIYSVNDVDCLAKLTIFACKNTYIDPSKTESQISSIKRDRNLAINKPARSEVPELEPITPTKNGSLPVVKHMKTETMDNIHRTAETVQVGDYL